MSNSYFYYGIISNTSTAFGSLFNDIYVLHQDGEGEDFSYIKVPIRYGPIQKFLARVEEKPDLQNRDAITLPRMSYQVGQISYDSTRKSSTTQNFKATYGANNTPTNINMPIPYNLPLELSIATKLEGDMFQIIEQILPKFRPEYNLSVNLLSTLGDIKDTPIVLQSISPLQDDYEGNFDSRRFIQCTLTFNAKISLYNQIPSDQNQKLIKKVQVDYYSDMNTVNASRVARYKASPRAIKDYNNDETTTLTQNIPINITKFDVSSATSLVANSYIQINNENMYITNIVNNTLTVIRGEDNTMISEHQEGDVINVINSSDDELIQLGDNFEFNEEVFNFGDGKIYSPRKGEDV